MLPSLLPAGPRSLLRVSKWTREWGALDPHEPHSHLGPLAVDTKLRGRGIGSQILDEYCRRLDADRVAAYLETETEENVRLYMRFGFNVVGEKQVLGRPNWFMLRPSGRVRPVPRPLVAPETTLAGEQSFGVPCRTE
jgi:hypothetical protein